MRTERADRLLRICGPQLAGPAERDQPAEVPGWATFQMPFVNEGAARGALLGFGTDVEVLAPSSLRRHFAETAAAIVRLYR